FFCTTLIGGIGLFSTWQPGGHVGDVVQNVPAADPKQQNVELKPAQDEVLDTQKKAPPPPQDLHGPAKDSDACKWLADNVDRFEFQLGLMAKDPPPPFILATKEKKDPLGAKVEHFIVTKEEAASIVQTLVD